MRLAKLGPVARLNSRTWDVKKGDQVFEASLGYIARSCLRERERENRGEILV
jgi:hypothetical protein